MVNRQWALDTACAIFPEVRQRTARAVREVEALQARLEEQLSTEERSAAEQEVHHVVSRWVREIEALGAVAKGPWLVDFDNGEGFFCWRWPEEELGFFHGYDAGFAGRLRIQ